MKSIIRLIFCLLLLVGWGLAALSLHVIRTTSDIPITLVTKERFGLADTYVDTRAWTLKDVAGHQALVEKLIRSGKADVLKHVVPESRNSDLAAQLSDALQREGKKDSNSTRPATDAQSAAQALFGLFR